MQTAQILRHSRRELTDGPWLDCAPARERAQALDRDKLCRMRLVSRNSSQLPLLRLEPGDGGVLLRPAESAPTVAAIDYGFPSFARGLIGQVEIDDEAATPFEFAMALTLAAAWPVEKLKDCFAFSGWVRVKEAFKLHDVSLTLPDLTAAKLHILFAVRSTSGSSPLPASSFFRKFVVVWDD